MACAALATAGRSAADPRSSAYRIVAARLMRRLARGAERLARERLLQSAREIDPRAIELPAARDPEAAARLQKPFGL